MRYKKIFKWKNRDKTEEKYPPQQYKWWWSIINRGGMVIRKKKKILRCLKERKVIFERIEREEIEGEEEWGMKTRLREGKIKLKIERKGRKKAKWGRRGEQ